MLTPFQKAVNLCLRTVSPAKGKDHPTGIKSKVRISEAMGIPLSSQMVQTVGLNGRKPGNGSSMANKHGQLIIAGLFPGFLYRFV